MSALEPLTPLPWARAPHHSDAIISVAPLPTDWQRTSTGHDDIEYYGGRLVCESVREGDREFILAAAAHYSGCPARQEARDADRSPTGPEPFWVYIAAPLTGLPSEYLANVAAISRLSRELMEDGFCPINPAADFLEGLMSPHPVSLDLYHSRSMDLLRLLEGSRRAALYVMRITRADGTPATGVIREIEQAREWGIAVVDTKMALHHLRASTERLP